MLTIQITRFGETVRMDVDQIEIVQYCHWSRCGAEFTTIDPDKLYCNKSHGVQASKERTLGPTLAGLRALAASTIGMSRLRGNGLVTAS